MTQPALFALTDGEHSGVTEGGVIVPAGAAGRSAKAAEERKRGDIAEYLCAIELTKRGYACNVIGGNCKGYDIIAGRSDVRSQFVQVKHGFLDKRKNYYYIYNCSSKRCDVYSATEYDILACYLWDRAQWLVYGRAEFGNRPSTTYTPPELRQHSRKSNIGIADRQPNNWELFDQLAMANSQESLGVAQQMSDPILNTP